jgi:hypothetical protein
MLTWFVDPDLAEKGQWFGSASYEARLTTPVSQLPTGKNHITAEGTILGALQYQIARKGGMYNEQAFEQLARKTVPHATAWNTDSTRSITPFGDDLVRC